MTTMVLPSLKEQFDQDGYCVVPDLFSEEEISGIETFFEDFKINGSTIFDGGTTYEDVNPQQRQVRAMHPHRHSSQAKQWVLQTAVMDLLAELLGREALAVQTMYYFKPPGAKGQGMHQDNFYLVSAPATCIAAWTAIDSATIENGCLWVVPGSHRHDIHCPKKGADSRAWNEYGDSHINPFPREAKPIPVEVPRGSTMFFGGNLIHGSGPNRSKSNSRRTFIGHYIDEASEQVAKFYHPVLDRHGETPGHVKVYQGGGPCGDDWKGGLH